MHACDALVIGGGPAGALAARTLALAGLRVVLADSVDPKRPKIGESLPGAALALLRSQGLLHWAERSRPARSVGNLSSWGDAALHATDFIQDPNGTGWHVDRAAFDQALRDAALDAGARMHHAHARQGYIAQERGGWRARTGQNTAGWRVFSNQANANWRVQFADGEVHARWLVDASGRAGVAGRWLNLPRRRDESMAALHAWGPDIGQDQRSLVEAVPEGWWYTAGVPGGRRVAALHVDPGLAATVLRSRDGWLRSLHDTLHVRGMCRADAGWTRPRGAEAGGSRASQACGSNWIAVGDAALAMDPLSSQGIFNALYTGLRGAQALLQADAGAGEQRRDAALAGYAARLAAIRKVYRSNAVEYYLMEQRWRAEPFWRCRHAAALHQAA